MKFKSALLTQASGSIGGLTASRNRGGMYMRSRALVTNPNTFRQQEARAALGSAVQAWENTLTAAQREDWRLYGQNVTVTDALGAQIQLSGQQMYTRTNQPRLNVTSRTSAATTPTVLARIDAAPTAFNTGTSVASITTIEIDIAGTGINVDGLFGEAIPANGDILLSVGAPQNAGVAFFKGPYQFAATLPVSATDTSFTANLDLPALSDEDWFSDFVPAENLLVPVQMRVSYDDGRLSQLFRDIVQIGQEVV